MGKITGFMEFERLAEPYQPVQERVRHWREFVARLSDEHAGVQGARCMDCGTPFCMSGCPVNNIIPDWNDLVYKQDWQRAIETLHSANNFPEVTGRICPAPCEAACVLGINDDRVAIKLIERSIADRAFAENLIVPDAPRLKHGKRVAVVGSGPAGMDAAQERARAGHDVTLLERDERIGGLLTYGIPDFKMEKILVERRVAQMQAEGVSFRTSVNVGVDVTAAQLVQDYDAVVLAIGARAPRDLPIPGRELPGIHFAMDFLTQQNRRVAGDHVPDEIAI